MRYAVTWGPVAEQHLAAIWLAAFDRNAVTAAVHRVDQSLALDPLRLGESRESSVRRYVITDGLGVLFEVIEDDKRVFVQGVSAVG